MLFHEIQPYIRLAHIFKSSEFIKKDAYTADNRLFYFLEGSGEVIINQTTYALKPGTLFLLPRGTCYRLPQTPCKVIGINFDYRFDENTNTQLLHPLFCNQVRVPIELESSFSDAPALNAPLVLHETDHLYPKLKEICEVYEKQKLYSDRICSGLMIAVLAESLTMYCAPQKTENPVDCIIEYVSKNYSLPLSNESIGKKFGYHPNYLNRLFVKQTGVSLHRYILNYRLSQTVAQMLYTKRPLIEIAQQCGFSDYAYFSRVFKQKHDASPSEYRKKGSV